MNKLQTVYISTDVEDIARELQDGCEYIVIGKTNSVYIDFWSDGEFYAPKAGEALKVIKPTEAFVFTPEELKQLLSDYTNRIVENSKAYIDSNNEWISPDVDCKVIKSSITSQLDIQLKELGI